MSSPIPHLGELTDCPTPARQSPDESLAAPDRTGQGSGNQSRTTCSQCRELLSVADEPYCAYLGCLWNNEQ